MTANDLIAAFEVLAEAPDGVKRLRELVLQLAVRGKLVAQNADETPASEPADRPPTRNRVARSPVGEAPYPAPPGWIWTTVSALGDTSPRNQVPDDAIVGFVPMAVVPKDYGASLRPETRPWGEVKKGFTHIADGDVVVAKITPCFENGKACVVAGLPGGVGAGTTELLVLRPHSGAIYAEYALAFFRSPDFVRGGVETFTGTAGQQRVSNDYFRCRPFPLPPVSEQRRIVARVDELMGLLDRLETARAARDDARRAARDAALAALHDAEDTDAFETAWGRIAGQMEALFADPADVGPLRQALLQLAVQGRLAPGPPASDWAATKLEDVCSHIVDCLHRTPRYSEEGYPAIRTSDIRPGRILWESARRVPHEEYLEQTRRLVPQPGDVFYAREGNWGDAAVVPEGVAICLSQRMMQFRLRESVLPSYFAWLLNAPGTRQRIGARTTGMTVPHVNIGDLRRLVIRIPPREVQVRIVAKVDELFAICDALESRLTSARALHEQFAAAAVHHLDL